MKVQNVTLDRFFASLRMTIGVMNGNSRCNERCPVKPGMTRRLLDFLNVETDAKITAVAGPVF